MPPSSGGTEFFLWPPSAVGLRPVFFSVLFPLLLLLLELLSSCCCRRLWWSCSARATLFFLLSRFLFVLFFSLLFGLCSATFVEPVIFFGPSSQACNAGACCSADGCTLRSAALAHFFIRLRKSNSGTAAPKLLVWHQLQAIGARTCKRFAFCGLRAIAKRLLLRLMLYSHQHARTASSMGPNYNSDRHAVTFRCTAIYSDTRYAILAITSWEYFLSVGLRATPQRWIARNFR